jgi:hypothetical protein
MPPATSPVRAPSCPANPASRLTGHFRARPEAMLRPYEASFCLYKCGPRQYQEDRGVDPPIGTDGDGGGGNHRVLAEALRDQTMIPAREVWFHRALTDRWRFRGTTQGVPPALPLPPCPVSKAASRARSSGVRPATNAARGSAFGSGAVSQQRGVQRAEAEDASCVPSMICDGPPSEWGSGGRGFKSRRPDCTGPMTAIVSGPFSLAKSALRASPLARYRFRLSAPVLSAFDSVPLPLP